MCETVLSLGVFKYVSNNGNVYLFRDHKNPKQMSNYIMVEIDADKKVLTIYSFFIDEAHKGMGKQVLDTIFSSIDSTWTICLDNNFNPSFWNHINTKYYPELKFTSQSRAVGSLSGS